MKKYRFIVIEKAGRSRYSIRNNRDGDLIGNIRSYQRWKRWCFEAEPGSIWSADCLRDVIDFIENEIPKGVKI